MEFVKKNGELRKMNCRLGVRKHWKTSDGSGKNYNPSDYGLICVFDLQKNDYRSINVDTLRSITADGVQYTVTD